MKTAQVLYDELTYLIATHAATSEIENKAVELQAKRLADEIDLEVIEIISQEFRNLTFK